MKYKIKKRIEICSNLDSSEMVMFTKGGRHQISVDWNLLEKIMREYIPDSVDHKSEYVETETELIFSVQMARDQQGRFEFVTGKKDEN